MAITFEVYESEYESLDNWAGPRELFPTIEVDQASQRVTITYWSIRNGRRGQWGCTHESYEELSADGQVLRITGLTGLRNDRRHTGGRQRFCFIVFVGDSGHIYTHRSVASKGWMTSPVDRLLSRIRRLGLGASDAGCIQQGDFLLRPANGQAQPAEVFAHEWQGAGHHRFSQPVLSAYVQGVGRMILVREGEDVRIVHEAVDGIQHPTVTVPAGQWIVGTTSPSLYHPSRRD
ncbi:MAG TPA: hypothetical protein PLE19_24010 [Planctomycetota bacterium]|nr:hypothetical protein [Planctomycetota bacterium]HRR83131.1 hypothetical protein [Planctomycetota bacterium]